MTIQEIWMLLSPEQMFWIQAWFVAMIWISMAFGFWAGMAFGYDVIASFMMWLLDQMEKIEKAIER